MVYGSGKFLKVPGYRCKLEGLWGMRTRPPVWPTGPALLPQAIRQHDDPAHSVAVSGPTPPMAGVHAGNARRGWPVGGRLTECPAPHEPGICQASMNLKGRPGGSQCASCRHMDGRMSRRIHGAGISPCGSRVCSKDECTTTEQLIVAV
jgi:hypothetical protein